MYGIADAIIIADAPSIIVVLSFSLKSIIPKTSPNTISNNPKMPAAPASISLIPLTSDHEAITDAIANNTR